ncbi:hypothetical protein K8R30_03120 [archaeon]|nr:hypothetical protein [archaeon]
MTTRAEKLTLILTLLGILLLIFLAQTKSIQTATISSIHYSPTKTTIQLENHSAELIIFDKINLSLNKNDQIKFQGKSSIYKNKKQIIIERISVLK